MTSMANMANMKSIKSNKTEHIRTNFFGNISLNASSLQFQTNIPKRNMVPRCGCIQKKCILVELQFVQYILSKQITEEYSTYWRSVVLTLATKSLW